MVEKLWMGCICVAHLQSNLQAFYDKYLLASVAAVWYTWKLSVEIGQNPCGRARRTEMRQNGVEWIQTITGSTVPIVCCPVKLSDWLHCRYGSQCHNHIKAKKSNRNTEAKIKQDLFSSRVGLVQNSSWQTFLVYSVIIKAHYFNKY